MVFSIDIYKIKVHYNDIKKISKKYCRRQPFKEEEKSWKKKMEPAQ